MQKVHRFNFETDYEEKQYDRLVKVCKAPLGYIEESIENYDLTRYEVKTLAKRLEHEYRESQT